MDTRLRNMLEELAQVTSDELLELWETVYSIHGNMEEQITTQRAVVRRFEKKIKSLEHRISRIESKATGK